MSGADTFVPGDAVEVFVRFNRSWVPGFEIAAITADGYQVRRTADLSLLPGFTGPADLRAGHPAFGHASGPDSES